MARKNKKINLTGEVTALDTRGHEVRKYQDAEGNWFVERNNNGAVHPDPCADEDTANKLFTEYCEQD